MKHFRIAPFLEFAIAAVVLAAGAAHAQLPVTAATSPEALLASADPRLAANKKLV
jgi:hypothetical protein